MKTGRFDRRIDRLRRPRLPGGPSIAAVLAAVSVWEALVRACRVPEWLLPAPSAIVREMWGERAVIADHAQATITEAVIGILTAVGLAVPIATSMALFPLLRQALYPLFVISQTVPIIALAPLIMVWFGYGMLPKVLVVLLVTFFPLSVSLAEGYRQADPRMVQLLWTMGARTGHVFRYVLWPQTLPSFFAGLRIATTYSVTGAVIGEWLGATKGLGVYLVRASKSFQTGRLFAAIAVIVIVSLVFFAVVELLSRWFLRWKSVDD
ncbi:MAG: ABC transporter permease [Hydrogenibacillus sp.]|nr:ABC transporter permease [Hydrogenibacillus sp.]